MPQQLQLSRRTRLLFIGHLYLGTELLVFCCFGSQTVYPLVVIGSPQPQQIVVRHRGMKTR